MNGYEESSTGASGEMLESGGDQGGRLGSRDGG